MWSEHMQIRKEEIKPFLSSVGVTVYMKNTKDTAPQKPSGINEFIKIAEFKINQKNQFTFLYTAMETQNKN